jgi:hypothetical protein
MIGEGVYSSVSTYDVDGRVVAVKSGTEELVFGVAQSLITEMTVLSGLDHPNVLGLIDAFALPGIFVLVLPYAAGGTLGQAIRDGKAAAAGHHGDRPTAPHLHGVRHADRAELAEHVALPGAGVAAGARNEAPGYVRRGAAAGRLAAGQGGRALARRS